MRGSSRHPVSRCADARIQKCCVAESVESQRQGDPSRCEFGAVCWLQRSSRHHLGPRPNRSLGLYIGAGAGVNFKQQQNIVGVAAARTAVWRRAGFRARFRRQDHGAQAPFRHRLGGVSSIAGVSETASAQKIEGNYRENRVSSLTACEAASPRTAAFDSVSLRSAAEFEGPSADAARGSHEVAPSQLCQAGRS